MIRGGGERRDAEGKHSKRSGKKRIDGSIGMKEAKEKKEKEKRKEISARRGNTSSSCNLGDVERSEMGTARFRLEGNADAARMIRRLIANGFRQHAAPLNSRVKWITRSDSRALGTYRSAEMEDSGEGIFRIL